jgi:DNA-binding response OmpR family regulator
MPDALEERRAILVVAVPGRIERVTRALIKTMEDVAVVGQAARGAAATAVLESGCADLVIWDAAVLDAEGWSTLAEAKTRWPRVPAIVLCRRAADELAAVTAGADAILRRHYHVDSLLNTVAALLRPPNRATGP